MQQVVVGFHLDLVAGNLYLDTLSRRMRYHRPRCLAHQTQQLHLLELGGPDPREIEELTQQSVETLALAHHQRRQDLVVGIVGHPRRQLLDRRADRSQRIANLVSQRRRERGHRLQRTDHDGG